MAHPYHEHRQHKVEHSRVGHITRGYAKGGAVHYDEAEDEKLIRKEVKKGALKRAAGGRIQGRAAGGRLDRKGKKRGETNVNVIVAPHPGGVPGGAGAPPPGIGAAAGPMPVPPPRPPMPPAGGPGMLPPGMPPGGPGGMPPPGGPPMIRARGGRVGKAGDGKGSELEGGAKTDKAIPKRARGGAVDGPAWKEGLRNGTQMQHSGDKDDERRVMEEQKGSKKVRVFKTGGKVKDVSVDIKPPIKGAVEAGFGNAKANPFPHMTAGSKSGVGRLEKLGKSRGTHEAA